jgi:hypothetical protein
MQGIQPNLSWLASNGQWNDGNMYLTFYNYYVTQIGQKFAGGYVKESTDDYDDYDLVINQSDMTFRLPLIGGERCVIETHVEGTDGYRIYSDGYCEQWGRTTSQPTSITFKKTMANADYCVLTTADVNITNHTGGREPVAYNLTVSGFSCFLVYAGNSTASYWDAGTQWKIAGYLASDQYTVPPLYFKVSNAVVNEELLDVSEVMDKAVLKTSLKEAHVVIDSYVNGTSGYRIWDDGYCEQWGETTGTYEWTYTTVTIPIPYPSKYNILVSGLNVNLNNFSDGNSQTIKGSLCGGRYHYVDNQTFYVTKYYNIMWKTWGYINLD